MFCACKKVNGVNYGSTCTGDNGCPIVRRNVDGEDLQVGLVSGGFGCGTFSYPGVYARVNKVYDWIQDYIELWNCENQRRLKEPRRREILVHQQRRKKLNQLRQQKNQNQ